MLVLHMRTNRSMNSRHRDKIRKRHIISKCSFFDVTHDFLINKVPEDWKGVPGMD